MKFIDTKATPSPEQNSGDTKQPELSRRRFLQAAAVTGVSAVVPASAVTLAAPAAQAQATHAHAIASAPASTLPNPIVPNFPGQYGDSTPAFQIPRRPLGSTGLQVSILGMGGYHLGIAESQDVVNNMVAKALDHGINLFDNAWEYHNGLSEERLGIALKGKRDQAILMTDVCTYGRNKDVAMRMLEDSLTRLQTDHLDVWQVHDVIYYSDPDLAYEPDGVLEALTLAKQQGKVRFVGFSGHKNPSIHLDMLHRGFHFDTVQMPINPFDPSFRSFEKNVLPVALHKNMAVISMKSMSGSGESIVRGALTPTEALSYAMSVPGVASTVSGVESMEVLDQNLEILRNFRPLGDKQMAALREHGRQFNDGRYELYKMSVKYDSDLGREQHHFPSSAAMPA
ncbi:MAG TPA: aldo/keto reductase [Granulicella sp.]|nr:aldo/keto reductase [Granulicella sp.]